MEIFFGAVAFDTEFVAIGFKSIQVITVKAAAKETAGQARPGEERRVMLRIIGPFALTGGAGNADAVGPRFLALHRQGKVGAAHDKRFEAMLVGILVGFLQARRLPVGTAKGMNAPGGVMLVQHLDNGANRLAGIITV